MVFIDVDDFHLLSEAQKHLARAASIDPENAVAKAFMKEVFVHDSLFLGLNIHIHCQIENRMVQSKTDSLKPHDEPPSDEDMDVDNTDSSLRGKRAKRTTDDEA